MPFRETQIQKFSVCVGRGNPSPHTPPHSPPSATRLSRLRRSTRPTRFWAPSGASVFDSLLHPVSSLYHNYFLIIHSIITPTVLRLGQSASVNRPSPCSHHFLSPYRLLSHCLILPLLNNSLITLYACIYSRTYVGRRLTVPSPHRGCQSALASHSALVSVTYADRD